MTRPKRMADDDDRARVLVVPALRSGEKPAEFGLNAQYVEVVAGHDFAPDAFDVVVVADSQRGRVRGGHRFDQFGIVAEVAEIEMRSGRPVVRRSEAFERDHAVGIAGAGQGIEQNGASPTEDGGVRAYPDGQRENHNDGKARIPPKLADRVADVGEKRFERRPLPDFATPLFHHGCVAEFAARGCGGFFSRHATRDEFLGSLFDVPADFVRDVAVKAVAGKQLLEPIHGFTLFPHPHGMRFAFHSIIVRSLFVAQRGHRIDAHRPPRRHYAAKQSGRKEHEYGRDEGHWIAG